MEKPVMSIIAAIGKNRVLGNKGELLWCIPDDLKRVKDLTMGHPIIMGRKTYESIGRPLPGRTNIVITRTEAINAPGCIIVSSLDKAVTEARKMDDEEIFIFGGAQIYEQALPFTYRLYLTLIDDEKDGDTFFPDYTKEFTKKVHEEVREHEGLIYCWVTLERT